MRHINIPKDYIKRKTSTVPFGYAFSEIDGYFKPVVYINGYFVNKFLMDFSLDLNGILPVVRFKFYTGSSTFLTVSYPKDGDIASIYIRSNVGVYKPIRMDLLAAAPT